MDWTIVEKNWDQYGARVKSRWTRLSSADLDVIAGDRMRLVSVIRELYGVSSDELEKQIQNFEERNKDYRPESPSCSKWRRVSVKAVNQLPQSANTIAHSASRSIAT